MLLFTKPIGRIEYYQHGCAFLWFCGTIVRVYISVCVGFSIEVCQTHEINTRKDVRKIIYTQSLVLVEKSLLFSLLNSVAQVNLDPTNWFGGRSVMSKYWLNVGVTIFGTTWVRLGDIGRLEFVFTIWRHRIEQSSVSPSTYYMHNKLMKSKHARVRTHTYKRTETDCETVVSWKKNLGEIFILLHGEVDHVMAYSLTRL